jgi:(p)ppGpp synthase/HD superfamily hydrolase
MTPKPSSSIDHSYVILAETMARIAHQGQVDKLGKPYIEHVEAVVAYVEEGFPWPEFKNAALCIAWLHDVVEDTDITMETLHHWFPRSVRAGVDAMTKREGEINRDYYSRCRHNVISRWIKLNADIRHNTDPERLAALDPETRERLERKYRDARFLLT